ncbi:MAG TPA: cyclophilin-like fold protein [Burkholderiales bacterium]|nr:cyclophilin-like fold protein [Burkholderiales bacterium]
MVKVRIAWKGGEVTANLRDTPTAKQLLAVLPCEASAHTWGDEVYFEMPLKAFLESDSQQVVDPGTVCFWVQGSSLALPFGPTPVSNGDECRLVTRCNVLGRIEGDPRQLKKVKQGVTIRVELLPGNA